MDVKLEVLPAVYLRIDSPHLAFLLDFFVLEYERTTFDRNFGSR
jgi:hypothetical protein